VIVTDATSFRRRRMRALTLRLAAVLMAGWGIPVVDAATTDIRTIRSIVTRAAVPAPMNSAQVVPPPPVPISSSGSIRITQFPGPANSMLAYDITHNVANETGASIRSGSPGLNGPIELNLPLGQHKVGVWPAGQWDASDLAAFLTDRLYVEIRSVQNPGGEIRGQFGVTYAAGQGPPETGRPVNLEVVVQNLGPDVYVGTEPSYSGWVRPGMPHTRAAGRLRISVDIDEPTKPQWPTTASFNVTQEFVVTIVPQDSVRLNFGQVDYVPMTSGNHTARATSTAQAPNVDPNPLNDQATTSFFVRFGNTALPAAGWLSLAVLTAVCVVVTARRLRARHTI
jgi:hypothetical protein